MTKAQKIIMRVAKSKSKDIMADKSIKRSERKAITSRIIAEATTQVENIDRAKNVASGKTPTCYVCGRKINLNPVYICGGLTRHGGCEAGSDRWMNSEIGKKSAYRKYFEGVNENV